MTFALDKDIVLLLVFVSAQGCVVKEMLTARRNRRRPAVTAGEEGSVVGFSRCRDLIGRSFGANWPAFDACLERLHREVDYWIPPNANIQSNHPIFKRGSECGTPVAGVCSPYLMHPAIPVPTSSRPLCK